MKQEQVGGSGQTVKRLTLLITAPLTLLLVGLNAHLHHRVPAPVHKLPPAQLAVGIHSPYSDCTPNDDGKLTRLEQAELTATESAMAKYNDTPDNMSNPDFRHLYALYQQAVTEYDTCRSIGGTQ